jgi:hypothetical protein
MLSLAAALCACALAPTAHASFARPGISGLADCDCRIMWPGDSDADGEPDSAFPCNGEMNSKRVLIRKLRLCPPWQSPKRPSRGTGVEHTTGHLSVRQVAVAAARAVSFRCWMVAEPLRGDHSDRIRTSIRPMGP